jgi:hypothetical protein
MTELTNTSSPSCNLQDLPDAILESIVCNLEGADRIRFMAVCRQTACVAMPTAEATLKIREHANFSGIKKVIRLAFPALLHAASAHHAMLYLSLFLHLFATGA